MLCPFRRIVASGGEEFVRAGHGITLCVVLGVRELGFGIFLEDVALERKVPKVSISQRSHTQQEVRSAYLIDGPQHAVAKHYPVPITIPSIFPSLALLCILSLVEFPRHFVTVVSPSFVIPHKRAFQTPEYRTAHDSRPSNSCQKCGLINEAKGYLRSRPRSRHPNFA